MVDTLFADVSEYQVPVDNRYPYKFLSIRSNDGTYRDRHFAQNYTWAKNALANGRLTGLIVYFVWRTNWQDAVSTHTSMCGGRPHPKQVTMIDVESWGGRIKGDQSTGLNAARAALVKWYSGDKRRVIGYGNSGDLVSLWPKRGDIGIVLASYGANPSFPGKLAHQFADNYSTPPFGPCDINSADGRSPLQFATQLGIA
jgi:hypothetical protein